MFYHVLIWTVNICVFAKKWKGFILIWLKINKWFIPSFDYRGKKTQKKEKKKNVGPFCSKCWNWVLDFFYRCNKCFCSYTETKVPKKVPLDTVTEFQVPIPVPYQFKYERYTTLIMIRNVNTITSLVRPCRHVILIYSAGWSNTFLLCVMLYVLKRV